MGISEALTLRPDRPGQRQPGITAGRHPSTLVLRRRTRMAWTVACACGNVFDCIPPAACIRCGRDVTEGVRIPQVAPTFDEWLAHVRDEIGDHTTTTEDGMAW